MQVAGDGKTVSVVTNTCSWPRVRVVGVAEAQVTAVLARDGSEAAAVTQPDFQGNTLGKGKRLMRRRSCNVM